MEERLFDRDGTNGAQFSLRNNFKGWNDRQPSELDQEEQKARIEQIRAQTEVAKLKTQTGDNDEIEDDGFLEKRDLEMPKHGYVGKEMMRLPV